MGKSIKRAGALLCICFAAMMALSGCRAGVDAGLTSEQISSISSAAGFLAAKVEESEGFIAAADENIAPNYAYLYDNAMALMASSVGADAHAQKIADAIVFAQGHDRAFNDGRLRNAYVSGDPEATRGGRSSPARSPYAFSALQDWALAGGFLHRLHINRQYGNATSGALHGGKERTCG